MRVSIAAAPFTYEVTYKGAPVIIRSPLGLELEPVPDAPFGELRITSHKLRTADRTWVPVWGKSSQVRDHFVELTLQLEERQGKRRRLGLIVRCYDEGVAFRYVVPAQAGIDHFVLSRELTGFRLPSNTTMWASSYKNFRSPYESEYPRRPLGELEPGSLVGLPALAQTGENTWAAITEADLTDWAGMYLRPSGGSLVAALSPRRDNQGLVATRAPRNSPWRVLMLSSRPESLIESNLIENLSEPSRLRETAWIKPGMMAWDHWWSGDVEMTTAADKRYIDLAATMGFPYQLIDWQWYGPYNKPSADITRPAPQLDMEELRRYAAARGVRLWLWIHSADVDRALAAGTLEAAFAKYQSWDIAGVKIDFMESDDQDRVRWYETVVKLAADHHLMVDFHGAFKPTGLRVTYPNLLTREGVLGNEYNKFSRRDTPVHKATLPFTRGLVGPMDYTPGGFLNRSPAEFEPKTPTEVMGSRANELALFVVYWSPLTCVPDDPAHYIVDGKEEPGLGFLRGLPTVWDETRALDGAVGEHVIVARRKGTDWWLGGITSERAYTTSLSLGFLGEGSFVAHIYRDPADKNAPYTALLGENRRVTRADTLEVNLREAGGIAIRFERVNPEP